MKEIERKFLVDVNKLLLTTNKVVEENQIEQGYLCKDDGKTVRIRIQDQTGFLTIKGKLENISRNEFEFKIPIEDAKELLKMCDKTIVKKRITIKYDKKYWFIDVFDNENRGLVIAEIELKKEKEKVSLPKWLLKEVSNDSKYYNCNLISNPFNTWTA